MTLQEYAEQELTELGFSDFMRPTAIETEDELHRQISDDLTLADKVREDIDRINARNIIYQDYEGLLGDWVWEKVEALHEVVI